MKTNNSIAFIFSHGPHGNSFSREGLDALLSTANLTKNIGVFFISDGILLMLLKQKPKEILARDFISTFNILSLYNINKLYMCADSIKNRGLDINSNWVLNVKCLSSLDYRQHLIKYDIILTF